MSRTTAADERINWKTSIPFLAFHLIPILAIFTGVTVKAVVLCVVLYFVRVFFITGGYHRYFAHRSYRLPRWAQLVMAVGGGTAMQKGALWWAAHHRDHHRWSDTDRDVHSPLKGFWWSHVGWILCDKYSDTEESRIKDFAKYPELRWLNRHDWVPPLGLALFSLAVAGWSGLVIGFGLSTILLWHGTFTVNSLAHVMGRRRFVTTDTSRNSWIIAVLTNGEGWHNNHHHYQASARQSFRWWEWDPTYYVLWALSKVGIVSNLKQPTPEILTSNLVADAPLDIGLFRARWHHSTSRLADKATAAAKALERQRSRLAHQLEPTSDDRRLVTT